MTAVFDDEPPEPPVTSPVREPTEATPTVPLLHVPPATSLNVVVAPVHTVDVPEIAEGCATTVTVITGATPQPFE